MGWSAARAVESAASEVAALIGADSDEIVFTSGATEANNLALFGLCRGPCASHRRKIVVGSTEHKSVLAVSKVLAQSGFALATVPVDTAGQIDTEALAAELKEPVLVVSIGLVNSEIGTIQNLAKISEMVRATGALLHTDAAQAPCALPLNDVTAHTDLLSLSGHKMYGPKGIGALYIRRHLQLSIEPLIYGGGQQGNLRSGTLPTALCVGLGASAALAAEGQLSLLEVKRRRDTFVRLVCGGLYSVRLNGPSLEKNRHPGNANLRFEGFSAHEILGALQPRLAASTGSACASGIPEPSHVLRAIGLSAAQADASLRFCIGRDTTDTDIEMAADLVLSTLSDLFKSGLQKAV